MPFLVRFLARHAAIGIGVATLFVALLVAFDVARLGTLLWTSQDGLLALIVLTLALGVTFGSVQMGFAVMLMSDTDDDSGGRKVRLKRLVPRFARVHAGRHGARMSH
ncbi:hypothetical protein V5F49_21700 [Xanthobacter sp. V3C-3]|uniref:hypothetical protein n=1 Tax=Xanthobacter lutulentifluminis TaxID=3119935 RepID=UPI003729DD08